MRKKFLIVFPFLLLIVICLYFIVTTAPSVRYWVDDFCSATLLRNNGYFASQIIWWKSWTGRFSYIAVLSFFELFNPWVVRIIPLILLALLVASFYPIYKFNKFLPLIFIFLVLINAPNLIQSFYWMTGSFNYVIPFIFLNLFLSLLIFLPRKTNIFVPGLLLFIGGGFNESYALAQFVLLIFIFVLLKSVSFPKGPERTRVVISGLLGSAAALIFMSLSPGNAARALTVTHPESLLFVIKSTIYGARWYLLRMLMIKPFLFSLMVSFVSIFILSKKIVLKKTGLIISMGISIGAAIFITMAVIGSGFYSMSIIPPERALFVAIYMILVCFFAFSFAAASLIKSYKPLKLKNLEWMLISVYLVVMVLLIQSTVSHWTRLRSEVQNYANRWDREEISLKDQIRKGKKPVIENITPVGELDSFTDNKGWVASCVAGYVGASDIKIVPQPVK